MDKDTSKSTLLSIELRSGEIRGLKDLKLHLRYPITVIAGRNGSGKSTVAAIAACAYHNRRSGFNPLKRKNPYYTFSDFFIQSPEEVPPQGISIFYEFIHDKWRRGKRFPDGVGRGWQERRKKHGGKWNNYDQRVDRNVVFLGIQRVVPHSEISVSKSYRNTFKPMPEHGWEDDVRETVGRILNKDYELFWSKGHSKYTLPMVSVDGRTYSGFNMGAGENALFTICSTIHACSESLLLVIDEIELGLHEEAQGRLIGELKTICSEKHIQIICTTHSPAILESLPPESRFFIERHGNTTQVLPDISPAFASGKLSGRKVAELDVYVEDEVAKGIVEAALDSDLRHRCNITEVGSATAVVRQLAARYKESNDREVCAILDGDMTSDKKQLVTVFRKSLESPVVDSGIDAWISQRLGFLPGDCWPERWILSRDKGVFSDLALEFGAKPDELSAYIAEAMLAGKHNEFRVLSEHLCLDESEVRARFTRCAVDSDSTDSIVAHVRCFLE